MIRLSPLYVIVGALFVGMTGTGSRAQGVPDTARGASIIGGLAPSVCRIDAPRTVLAVNALYESSSEASGQVTIGQLADPVTSISRAVRIALDFPAVCNHTHTLIVRSVQGGLTRIEGTGTAGFASRIDYNLSARWAGGDRTANLTGEPRAVTISVLEGAAGNIELNLEAPGGGSSLVAGNYQDQVVVEFAATS